MIGGRSINLALSTRGIHALEQIGIADEVLKHAIPMRGRMIHPAAAGSAPIFVPYDVDPNKHIDSIGRAALNPTVIEAAQRYPNVRVHFNHRCTNVDLTEATANLETGNGQTRKDQLIPARGDAVIGVDGAFSAVRQSMQEKLQKFDYDESYLAHGYKELTIPPAPKGSWQVENDALVPLYGQGMNAGFEDCVVLDECLAEFPDNRERAFAEYFVRRKENADALADLAIDNFIEMRDKTASKTFRAKKKLDHALEAALPGIYLPLYTMVTFTRIPYAQAAQRARRQDSIIYTGLTLVSVIIVALLIHFIA